VGAQSGTWVSGIMIQNQSTTQDANITVTFYWAEGQPLAGQVACQFSDVIPAGQAKAYYVPNISGLPEGFVGSAVVSSDQPVAANLNTQLPSGTGATPSDPNRVGTASGVLSPSNTLYFTQVMKDYWGWNSYIAVQNTSDTQANVTVRYYNDSDGSEVTAAVQNVTIKPYSTYIFRQSENANLPASWGGSVVVQGDQPLAGVANFYNAGTSVETAAFQSYNAFGSGATKLYVPRLVKDYYGYQGGLKIQNVGTADTDVTITYYFGGNTYTQTINGLKPGAAVGLYMPNVTELAGVSGSGSAVITSSGQPIVATVNEDNRTLGQGITYNAVPEGSQTTTVLFPQVTSRFYGYSGGIQVQNVGTGTAHVVATFSAQGFTDVTVSADIGPNESVSWFAPDVVSGAGFNGSVVVTADQPIVGIANNSYRADRDPSDGWAPNYGDSYMTYNGINK
ncbi:MAG: hypothetical protein J7M05_12110, partial [Anaerolineae bacterium]|nr:hypothetical protein [Anaerolineae bacterium]